jgi:predicted phosphoadenosine phosphosulfate sulfurtransferase
MGVRVYQDKSVYQAAKERINYALDNTERAYIAFSGGKDSSILTHLVMEEAIKRNQKIGLLYVDFEAQYKDTIDHVYEVYSMYKDMIDPHWVCVPMLLRNALTNYVPQWMCWDPDKKDLWIRDKPNNEFVKHEDDYPFCEPGMEFEEFTPLFGEWYGEHGPTAAFIGIRAQESLHRYCSIATWEKRDLMLGEKRWTTRISKNTYNVYPIYDWLTDDIWKYHAKNPDKPYNKVYDKMQMAGVKLSQQRLCQPFGDDQRRGLWLYHILEPETWAKLVARVNGANSGALYVQNSGNMTGYNKITKPEGHTWKSFCNLLLQTMPQKTREHYIFRFKKFIYSWHKRGYGKIPEEAPPELEAKCWAPSWRRMCKVLLRNDYWCKGLGMSQPKSEAYQKFKAIKAARKKDQEAAHA